MADERGAWRSYGGKTIYDNQWVRMGLLDVEAPNGERFDATSSTSAGSLSR